MDAAKIVSVLMGLLGVAGVLVTLGRILERVDVLKAEVDALKAKHDARVLADTASDAAIEKRVSLIESVRATPEPTGRQKVR